MMRPIALPDLLPDAIRKPVRASERSSREFCTTLRVACKAQLV